MVNDMKLKAFYRDPQVPDFDFSDNSKGYNATIVRDRWSTMVYYNNKKVSDSSLYRGRGDGALLFVALCVEGDNSKLYLVHNVDYNTRKKIFTLTCSPLKDDKKTFDFNVKETFFTHSTLSTVVVNAEALGDAPKKQAECVLL